MPCAGATSCRSCVRVFARINRYDVQVERPRTQLFNILPDTGEVEKNPQASSCRMLYVCTSLFDRDGTEEIYKYNTRAGHGYRGNESSCQGYGVQ